MESGFREFGLSLFEQLGYILNHALGPSVRCVTAERLSDVCLSIVFGNSIHFNSRSVLCRMSQSWGLENHSKAGNVVFWSFVDAVLMSLSTSQLKLHQ